MSQIILTTEQIDQLFTFVRKKYVRWIDVQYEIVDHIATGIEQSMSQDTNLSFDQALHKEYTKFPITGFSELVSSKEKALTKYWARRFFTYMISFFKLPKIIIAVFLTIVLKTIFQVFMTKGLYFILFLVAVAALCSHYIRKEKGLNAVSPEMGKYLVTNTFVSFNSGVLIAVFISPLNILFDNFKMQSDFSGMQLWFLSILFAVVFLWGYANTFVFPEMLKEELKQKYGHLNIQLN